MQRNDKPLLASVSTCLFIITEWADLSDGLLWFLLLEFKVADQLIGLQSVGVTTQKSQ